MSINRSSLVGILLIGVIVIALPITVFFSQQQQQSQQHATSTPSSGGTITLPTDGQGLYEGCSIRYGTECLAHLDTMAAAGFKLVMNYGSLYGSPADLKAYADKAQSLGMKVIWAIHESWWWDGSDLRTHFPELTTACNCFDSTSLTKYVVNLVKNYPATWGYYVGDELTIDQHTAWKVHSDLIHQTDPNHPRLFVGDAESNDAAYTGQSPFWDGAEVIADDHYPVGRNGYFVPTTAQVASGIQAFADTHSIQSGIVLQSFSFATYNDPHVCSPYPACAVWPTSDQEKQMLLDAVTNMHSRLVLWYSYGDILNSSDSTRHWNDLVTAVNSVTLTTSPISLSVSPTSKPTNNPSGATFSLTLCPHGLGKCGDNANPSSVGNANPLHTTRNVTVTIFDTNNNQVAAQTGQVHYVPSAQNFQGTISTSNLSSGQYLVFVKMDGFLGKRIPSIVSVTQGQTTTLPAISLVNGDINNDNQLDIQDYNILISCFGSKFTTSTCLAPATTQSPGADVDDDGTVDGVDYNLFLRELSVLHGG